jgi:hypothetical protein
VTDREVAAMEAAPSTMFIPSTITGNGTPNSPQ